MTVSIHARQLLGKLGCLALVTSVSLSISSCADPGGEFDKFVERANQVSQMDAGLDVLDDATVNPDTLEDAPPCTMITQADVANGYLFTLSANIVPNKPFVSDATVTIDEAASTISFSVQPLRADDKTTPVGAPILGGPFPIEPDGSFEGDFGEISMDGAANPISGSELATSLLLIGKPGGWCSDSDFVCGDAEGIASKPIKDLDLKGSTFTFQKLSAPGVYPDPLINCAKDKP